MADVRVASPTTAPPATKVSPARDAILELKARIGKSVLGQDHLVESMLIGLLANGNLLIESLPGLAKTRAVKTLAKNLAADLSRVQFTPDLLPSDVTGAEIYLQTEKGGQFQFQKGPIFANLVLADEINRAPAKVQSALLEAMEERQVTVAGKTYKMPDLFMLLATENRLRERHFITRSALRVIDRADVLAHVAARPFLTGHQRLAKEGIHARTGVAESVWIPHGLLRGIERATHRGRG